MTPTDALFYAVTLTAALVAIVRGLRVSHHRKDR